MPVQPELLRALRLALLNWRNGFLDVHTLTFVPLDPEQIALCTCLEHNYCSFSFQTTGMRAAATTKMAAVIAGFKSAASDKQRAEVNAVGSGTTSQSLVALRNKLKNAINVMQTGLIERDVEVIHAECARGPHVIMHSSGEACWCCGSR